MMISRAKEITHIVQLKKMKNKIVMSIVINNKSKVSYIYNTINKICLPYFYIVLQYKNKEINLVMIGYKAWKAIKEKYPDPYIP